MLGILLYLLGVMLLGHPHRAVRCVAVPICWSLAWLTLPPYQRDEVLGFTLLVVGIGVGTLAASRPRRS